MEYHKILVPLDGSKLAETVLPHVEKIALGCAEPKVILLSVTQPVHVKTPAGERIEQLPAKTQPQIIYYGNTSSNFGGTIVPKTTQDVSVVIGKMAKSAYSYLAKIAQNMLEKGIEATIIVGIGNVAEEIGHIARDEEADLIIMAGRGKRGLKRWDVANAAEKVFRETTIPIMLIKPPSGFKETKPVRKGKAI
jgi:nucleotide-binding universal stress UspA family protein